jgi:four helix bundle protein
MKDFRELKVWEKSHRLALSIYRHTREFPPQEQYGLTSQMRRAALSIPTNIAEGCGRNGDTELARFMDIAFGSASELEYLIFFSGELELLKPDSRNQLHTEVVEVKRMLSSFLQKLRADRWKLTARWVELELLKPQQNGLVAASAALSDTTGRIKLFNPALKLLTQVVRRKVENYRERFR